MSETHDPWDYLAEFIEGNAVRPPGGQQAGSPRYPLVPSVARELRQLVVAGRAARAAEATQHQQEMARLRALMLSDEDRIVELLAERDRLKAAFLELHATVKGDCPSLLDPDRGGSDVLWALCAAALTPHQGQSTDGETR